MKKIIVSILVITVLLSCIKEQKTTTIKYKFKNNSNHKLKFYKVEGNKDVILLSFTEYSGQSGSRGKSSPLDDNIYWFANPYDSVKITYNDTLTVYHGSKNYNVLRDIRKVKSYKYEHPEDYVYSYEYTFTNADFNEAKTINGL